MALIDKASLLFVPSVVAEGKAFNILPSGNRAPDSTDQNSGYDQTRADFDFDRGSNAAATRVNADGLIEKGRENLFTYSNDFTNAAWTKFGSPILTSGQSGYDGSSDAWLYESTTISHSILQFVSGSGVYSLSVYAKAGTADGIRLRFSASTDSNIYVDLTDGSIITNQSGISYNIESVGSGWYRVSITSNVSSLSNVRFSVVNNAGAGTDSGNIYIQDAQLETGLVATDVLTSGATTAKAGVLVDLPRINYDANGENGSLLLEPSRTNLVQYSEYFGGWGQINTINTANALTSPEGLQNANKLIAASGVNNNVINQQISAGTYTASVFAKKGEFEGLFIGSGPTGAFFNLNTYAYRTHYQSAPTSYKIEDYGNGWHRYSITFTISGNDSLYIGPNDNVSNTLGVTGNNSNGIYIYGAQIEEGSYPTSLIPNHGTSGGVTRAADITDRGANLSYTGNYTLFMEFNLTEDAAYILNATTLSAWSMYVEGSFAGFQFGRTGGDAGSVSFASSFDWSAAIGTNVKIALVKNGTSVAMFVNGTKYTPSANTLSTGNEVLDWRYLNYTTTTTRHKQNYINQLLEFEQALSDAECVTLTTL